MASAYVLACRPNLWLYRCGRCHVASRGSYAGCQESRSAWELYQEVKQGRVVRSHSGSRSFPKLGNPNVRMNRRVLSRHIGLVRHTRGLFQSGLQSCRFPNLGNAGFSRQTALRRRCVEGALGEGARLRRGVMGRGRPGSTRSN